MATKVKPLSETAKGRIFNASGGCNENCGCCPFPDCYKPLCQMGVDKLAKATKKVVSPFAGTDNRMYTLELGGVGRNTPNLSKKFYL